jgi:DNA-3-methyladenine glycosylase II
VLALYGESDPAPQALLDTPDESCFALRCLRQQDQGSQRPGRTHARRDRPHHKRILKLADAEIIERLSEVRGIGTWTVEMLLIFRLGRPDVFPVTDYGVRKGFALTFQRVPKSRAITAADLPKPEVMLKRAKRWAPYRSVAAWYMWRACDLDAASRKLSPKRIPRRNVAKSHTWGRFSQSSDSVAQPGSGNFFTMTPAGEPARLRGHLACSYN